MAKVIIKTEMLKEFEIHSLNDVIVSFKDEIKAITTKYNNNRIEMTFGNIIFATNAVTLIANIIDLPFNMEIENDTILFEDKIKQIAANLAILFDNDVKKITHYLITSNNDVNAILEDTENGVESMVSDAESQTENYPQ